MLQQSITDLIHGNGPNKRGVCSVIGVPKDWVQSMPDEKVIMKTIYAISGMDFYVEDIILKDGYSWLTLSKDDNLNLQFDEAESETKQLNSFTYNIPMPVPHDDYEQRGKVFRAYRYREWILIVKQRSGAWRVIGSMERGAVYVNKFSSGSVGADLSMNDGGFTWSVGGRAAYYAGSFLSGSYWFRCVGENAEDNYQVIINEPVIINWGDGKFEYYPNYGMANNVIVKSALGFTNCNFVVYHHNRAGYLGITGDGVNGGISEILGTIPNRLKTLDIQRNPLLQAPTNAYSIYLNEVTHQYCALDDSALEAAMETLDLLNTSNRMATFSNQIPPVIPTPATLVFKSNLESRGWIATI